MNVTHWLYRGGRVLTAVRAPADATDAAILATALDHFDRAPGVYCAGHGVAPFEMRAYIAAATVVREGASVPATPPAPARLPLPNADARRVRCVLCDFKIAPGRVYVVLDGKAYHRTCANEQRIGDLEAHVYGTARTMTTAVSPDIVRPLGVPRAD